MTSLGIANPLGRPEPVGAFHAPQTTTNRAAKSWLPVKITAYGGMHLVRKAHPAALTAERHHRVINSLVRFYLRLPCG
jgi:hypothetical protein